MTMNTSHIKTPDDPLRVYKVRRLSDKKFKQIYSVSERNDDSDRWGHGIDRVWLVEDDAQKQADKEKFDCEVVHFALVEIV